MRIYQLFHAIVDKFVPMEEQSKLELQSGALAWYNQHKDNLAVIAAKNKEAAEYNEAHKNDPDFIPKPIVKPAMKDKIFELLEQWWVRYLIAIAFIFIVPKVKAIINGEGSAPGDDDEEDDEGDDFEEYMKYRRFKKSMQ